MTDLREQLVGVIRMRGLMRFDEPVTLASGEKSREFIDTKAALSRGEDLELACNALLERVSDLDFDAVGGMTMGADQFAHVVAVLARREWFVVRKAPKGRGTDRLLEGAKVGAGWRVLVVDDVVTTGGSMRKACETIEQVRAEVVGAVAIVDRGEAAARYFEERKIPYRSVLTYRDLGIEPVGGGSVQPQAV
ncbi:MAG: orotate phosphoribosyltransferase [Acidimicrobiales bacterium]